MTKHCQEQIYYYGEKDGLLRRHDDSVDVMFGATGANYPSEFKNIEGIMIPMKRRVYGRDVANNVQLDPVLITIDVKNITLTREI